MPMDVPITWQISKVENTTPRGIVALALYQDTFNPKTDYIDKSDPDHWRMYADYNKFPAEPEVDETESQQEFIHSGSCVVSSTTALFKVGGTWKTLTATIFDEDNAEMTAESYTWSFKLGDGTDATNLVETKAATAANKIKVKFLGDESYVGKQLIAVCSAQVTGGNQPIVGEESFDVIFM